MTEPITTHPDLYKSSRHVYFVQAVVGGPIKIGASNDPQQRLAALEAGSPFRLRLVGVIWNGTTFRERMLHERFAANRSHGEWFHPAPDLLAYIAENATDPATPLAEVLDSVDPGEVAG